LAAHAASGTRAGSGCVKPAASRQWVAEALINYHVDKIRADMPDSFAALNQFKSYPEQLVALGVGAPQDCGLPQSSRCGFIRRHRDVHSVNDRDPR
jgi:hypothetical protein